MARVTRSDPNRSEVEILRLLRSAPATITPLTLAFAPPRAERSDLIVEKATELGVRTLLPLLCERLQGFEVRGAGRRVERWRRKAQDAARQCGRTSVPQVGDPVELAELFRLLPDGVRLLGDLRPGCMPIWQALNELKDVPASLTVIVGPAGGLTARELKIAAGAGARSISLGSNILRVETAAIAMLAAVAFWLDARGLEPDE